MNKLFRRTMSATFALTFLVAINIFFFASQNPEQYTKALWSLFATCVSLTIVLVLNH